MEYDFSVNDACNVSPFGRSATSKYLRDNKDLKFERGAKSKKLYNKAEVLAYLNKKYDEKKSDNKTITDWNQIKAKASAEREQIKLKKEKIELKKIENQYIEVSKVKDLLFGLTQMTKSFWNNNVNQISTMIASKLELNNEQLKKLNVAIESTNESFLLKYVDFIENKKV
jgi:hypothetical protein